MAGGAAGAAAAAAAIAQATKASGAIVRIGPDDFKRIVERCDEPLVVISESKFFSTTYKYLTSYKGLFFFTKSKTQLMLPGKTEFVNASNIWIPG